jgi:ribonuclease HI
VSEPIRIFTDGSAIGNPGPGGWAALLLQGTKTRVLSGGNSFTCIAEMEITAAVHALRSLPESSTIILSSDSELLIQGMEHLALRWDSHGWKNRRGKPLQFCQLWIELLELNRKHSIRWKWVKGHNGHPEQERVDKLAYAQASAWRQYSLSAA